MMCRARDSSYSRCPTSRNRSLYLLVPMGVPLVNDVTRGEAARFSMLAWTSWVAPGGISQVGTRRPQTPAASDHDPWDGLLLACGVAHCTRNEQPSPSCGDREGR